MIAFINKKFESQLQGFCVFKFVYFCIQTGRACIVSLQSQLCQSPAVRPKLPTEYSSLYICHNRPAEGNSLCNSTVTGKNLSNLLQQPWQEFGKSMTQGSAVKLRPMAGEAGGVHHRIACIACRRSLFLLWPYLLTEATGGLGLKR